MKYKNYEMYKALKQLDAELYKAKVKPFRLNAVGGFALMMREIREKNDYTDIDYVGDALDPKIQRIIEKVGKENGFESDWVNNDVMCSGCTLEDFEFATGKLHFSPVSTDFRVIQLYALEKEDLLRMKVIAIDTMLVSVKETGGVFTRVKDFADIKALMEDLQMSVKNIHEKWGDYILEKDTYALIGYYNRTQDNKLVTPKAIRNAIEDQKSYIQLKRSLGMAVAPTRAHMTQEDIKDTLSNLKSQYGDRMTRILEDEPKKPKKGQKSQSDEER